VVPTGTRPWHPANICRSTNALRVVKSKAPSLNGVTNAGIKPLNMTFSLQYGGDFSLSNLQLFSSKAIILGCGSNTDR
jgi:hypothetical protein